MFFSFLNPVAPSIYENEDIKKGILCQLFGGANKDFTDTGRGKFRFVWSALIEIIIWLGMYCYFLLDFASLGSENLILLIFILSF